MEKKSSKSSKSSPKLDPLKISPPNDLSHDVQRELLAILKSRFDQNLNRHKELHWGVIQTKLEENPQKLWSVYQMEQTGGEPDVVGYDPESNEYLIYDCSLETPKKRRNLTYDSKGQSIREEKGVFPSGNAVDVARAMGIALLNEEQYRSLQNLGKFDTKSSSWILTPEKIRKLGGALFGGDSSNLKLDDY